MEAIGFDGMGLLRVRIREIRIRKARLARKREVTGKAYEIPTPGLGIGPFSANGELGPPPLSWIFGSLGSLFSDDAWMPGYGGGRAYFNPRVIRVVLFMVRELPLNMAEPEKYCRISAVVEYPEFFSRGAWRHVYPSDD